MKLTKDGMIKFLFKELAKDILPPNFPIERKQGFSIPLSSWLSTKWKKQTKEILLSIPSEILNKDYVLSLLEKEGKLFNNNNRIYAILILLVWKERYNIDL